MSQRLGNKSHIALLASVLFFVALVPLSAAKSAKIQFDSEKHDFGKVKQGKVLTHTFKFKNAGDDTLVIKNVRTTCGCTAAVVKGRRLAPGDQGEIKVTLNTTGYGGPLSKYIFVDSNDSSQPMKQLLVSVAIDVPPAPQIELDNYTQDLGLILDTDPIETTTKIKNTGELELTVELAHKDAEFFRDEKKVNSRISVAAGKSVEITIKMPARKRAGLLREYVLIRSNDKRRPTLSLYLSGYAVTKKQLKELFKKYRDILK
jgi:hypothetical protein